MRSVQVSHEVKLLEGARDKAELGRALAVYSRSTSQGLRTQTRQIQAKFERPDNPHGTMFYASLREQDVVVGFSMFAYYPRSRLVVIDHIAIDEAFRKHGSFYVFASMLQTCIEARCQDYDYVAVEVATDPEFARDGVNGEALVRLLRQVGFGRVHVPYDMPGMDAKVYSKPHRGTLMLRGAQKVSEIRCETLLDIHSTILFEHYLPWFETFLGKETTAYKVQLERLHARLGSRLKGQSAVKVNGGEHDELTPRRATTTRRFLGVEHATLGHVVVLGLLFLLVAGFQALIHMDERLLVITVVLVALIGLAFAAGSSGRAYKTFDRFGALIARLLSRT